MHVSTCFCKKNTRSGAYEGSCKFLYERFGGKRGSWLIQQRGALRWWMNWMRCAHEHGTPRAWRLNIGYFTYVQRASHTVSTDGCRLKEELAAGADDSESSNIRSIFSCNMSIQWHRLCVARSSGRRPLLVRAFRPGRMTHLSQNRGDNRGRDWPVSAPHALLERDDYRQTRHARQLIQLNINKDGLHALEWKTRDPYSLVNDCLMYRECTVQGVHVPKDSPRPCVLSPWQLFCVQSFSQNPRTYFLDQLL